MITCLPYPSIFWCYNKNHTLMTDLQDYQFQRQIVPQVHESVEVEQQNWSLMYRHDYINNKLLWARKYARIVVRGYYMFWEANSCPRAKLQIFPLTAKAAARKQDKTKHEAKHIDFLMLSGTAFSTSFQISSSGNWRKTLHFDVSSSDGGYWLWAGIIGW